MMRSDVVDLDGPKSPQSHVQRYERCPYAPAPDLIQKLLRKVEARRRCRSAAGLEGLDGLVSVLILKLMRDIGRERHFSQLVQDLFEDPLIFEFDKAVPPVEYVQDHSPQ